MPGWLELRIECLSVFSISPIEHGEPSDQQKNAHDAYYGSDCFLLELISRYLFKRRLRTHQQDLPDAGNESHNQKVFDRGFQIPSVNVGEDRAEQF